MKLFYCTLLLSMTLFYGFDAHAAGSLLRVACDGDDVGAEVFLNGKFKGECPVDIQVSEGTFTVRVAKKVDAQREQSFVQDVRIGDGTVKKVAVVLSAPRLNAVAQKREDDRLRMERAEAAKQEEARQELLAKERRQDEALLAQQQRDAANGDSAAMVALGDRYAKGKGVNKNEEEANAWYRQAATAGNEIAIFKLSDLHKTGKKENVDAILRLLQLPTGPERNVSVEGAEKIRAFVASDPFFEVPGGNQVATFSFGEVRNNSGSYTSGTCSRESRFFHIDDETQYSEEKIKGKRLGVLGGLLSLKGKFNDGFFFQAPIYSFEPVRLEKLRGQPFPLTAGQRFGMTYVRKQQKGFIIGDESLQLDCAIDVEAVKATGQERIAGTGQPLICLCQFPEDNKSLLMRYSWHEASGCFLRESDK